MSKVVDLRNKPLVTALFQKAGLRLILATKDDFYMLVPSEEEQKRYGISCLSIRAVEALESVLSQS